MGMKGAEEQAFKLPEPAIPGTLDRVRRIRRSWPTYTEFLEADHNDTLAELTQLFQGEHDKRRTPLQTLHSLWDEVLDSSGSKEGPNMKERLLFWLMPKRHSLQNLDRYYRQVIAESKKPFLQRRTVPVPNDPVSRMAAPAFFPTTEQLLTRPEAELDLLEVALAVRMHRLETGRYPERLTEVSHRWLPAVPVLPWGQPVTYAWKDGRPVIAVVEAEGKGRRVFGALQNRRRAGSRG
jgi:hypothetical protein